MLLRPRTAAWLLAAAATQCARRDDSWVSAAQCSSWSARYEQHLDGVCVCNASSCDSVSSEYLSLSAGEAGVFQTSKAGDRLAYSILALRNTSSDEGTDVVVDSTATFQEIIGFGGAFTDATAINVYSMGADVQQQILDAYFSDSGLQYTLGRVPIASTDFSESVYSYNPWVDDFEMTNFSIAVDKAPLSDKLELIQRALNESTAAGRNLTLFASSWAPPVWMTTGNTTVNCAMKGTTDGPYWQALALYYSKFISAYEEEGVPIWAITTQNEPTQPVYQPGAGFQSLRFNTTTERDFLKNALGPIMQEDHPQLKIIILDDQKDFLLDWDAALLDEDASQYVSGIGLHWYKDVDFEMGADGNFDDVATFHDNYPDVFILATEACEGYLIEGVGTANGAALLDSNIVWQRGENYARDIINDLASYASGWTDWNLVLNTTGGPNWAANEVDAPILVDAEGGDEFYKQPMYYVMGHVSKFLVPGSVMVQLNISEDVASDLENVDRVAFLTPDGQLVLVLTNRDSTEKNLSIYFSAQGSSVEVTLPGNAMQTILVPGAASSSNDGTEDETSASSSAIALAANGIRGASVAAAGLVVGLLLATQTLLS